MSAINWGHDTFMGYQEAKRRMDAHRAEEEARLRAEERARDEARRRADERTGGRSHGRGDGGERARYEDAYSHAGDDARASGTDQRHRYQANFDLLGVKPGASTTEMRKACLRLVKENHPDRFATAAPAVEHAASERTKLITAAYRELKEHGRAAEQSGAPLH